MPTPQYPTNLSDIVSSPSTQMYLNSLQQARDAQRNEQLNQAKALQDLYYSEQENPLKLQEQALKNEGAGYDNRSKSVKARTDEALMPSAIDSGVATNKADAQKAHVENLAKLAEMGGQLADMVDNGVPVLSLVGKVPDQIYQILSQPGGTQRIRQMAQKIAANSAAQLQKMQEVNANNASAEKRTKYTADTQMGIEQAGIAAGKYNRVGKGGQGFLELAMKAPTLEAAIAKLQIAREFSSDPEQITKIDEALGNVKAAWQAKLRAGYKPGVDPAATAQGGNVVGTTPVEVPGASGNNKPDPLGIR